MFKGYIYLNDGRHTEPILLLNKAAAVAYAIQQGKIQHEVLITDEMDAIALHIIKGKVVFPDIQMGIEEVKAHGDYRFLSRKPEVE